MEANANEVTEEETSSEEGESDESPQDVNALLENALNLVTDNDIVRDYIANAINAAAE